MQHNLCCETGSTKERVVFNKTWYAKRLSMGTGKSGIYDITWGSTQAPQCPAAVYAIYPVGKNENILIHDIESRYNFINRCCSRLSMAKFWQVLYISGFSDPHVWNATRLA